MQTTTTKQTKIMEALLLENLSPMTEERFERMFNPIPNHFMPADELGEYAIHSSLLDPSDQIQIEYVRAVMQKDPRRIWTLMDVGGQDVLVSGYQYARRAGFCRLGYLISTTAVNDGIELYIQLNKKLA